MEVGILVMLINNKAIYVDKQSGMFYKKKLRMCNAFNWKNNVITCDFYSESFTDTLLLEVPML